MQLRKSDFGLDTVLSDIPNVAHALGGALSVPTDINSLDISLNGTVGGQGFMRNPTSCGTKTTKFTADSYANPNQKVTGQATFTSTNCAALPFSPTLSGRVGSAGPHEPAEPADDRRRSRRTTGEAGLQNAQVLLPHDLGAEHHRRWPTRARPPSSRPTRRGAPPHRSSARRPRRSPFLPAR